MGGHIVDSQPLCYFLGSVPSLGAGLTFGGIAMFGAYQTSQNPKNVWVSLGR